MATLSTKEYAELRGISQRAVQRSISDYNRKAITEFGTRLIGVDKIQTVGAVSQLVMKRNYQRTIDAYNKKKEKA